MRTPEEIVERINQIRGTDDDFFGHRQEVLLYSLPWEHLEQYLSVESATTEETWKPLLTDEAVIREALEYFHFAIGKIIDHRGLSASRSVEKLTEYAWLLGKDDLVQAMGDTEYSKYGAPIVMLFGRAMGFSLPELDQEEAEMLDNMANGERCKRGCDEGC